MRNGQIYRRTPGIVSTSKYRIGAIGASVTAGADYNRQTGGAYTRATGDYYFTCVFLLEQLLWDIRNTTAYTIDFVDSGAASPTVLKNVMPSTTLTGGAENTINVNPPIVILPGRHYLSISSASTTYWDYNAAWQNYTYFVCGTFWYGGNAWNYNQPTKLVGKVLNITGLSNYEQYLGK